MTRESWKKLRGDRNLPLLMGIVNVTPDSFFDGGRYNRVDAAVDHALHLAADGADILDIGGESTKPGAEPVSLEDELARVIPVISRLKRECNLPISIDTYKSRVANAALEAGADIVNDISFGTFDKEMFSTVAASNSLYVGMHIQGTPRNMQKNPHYENVLREVSAFLFQQANQAENAGILRNRIAIDPGIGFGKNDSHNLSLLRGVRELKEDGYPVLIGASRKSMMGRLLGLPTEDRLAPSIAIAIFSAERGADIIRVHDVLETRTALKMWGYLSE